MAIEIHITDNSEKIKSELERKIEKSLTAVGIHLQGEAGDALEMSPRRVDTGRLKGSINYATSEGSGSGSDPATAADWSPHGTPEKGTLYIGTNVDYGPYVHDGTSRMAPNRFLKNAISMNQEQIKRYVEDELKNG